MRELALHSTKVKTVDVVAAWLELPGDFVQVQRRPIDAKHDPGLISLFGGMVEPGEGYEAALRRELDEELVISRLCLSGVRLSEIGRGSGDFYFDSTLTGRSNLQIRPYRAPISEPLAARDGTAEIYSHQELAELARDSPGKLTLGAQAVTGYILGFDQP